jgi:hypothetical protein
MLMQSIATQKSHDKEEFGFTLKTVYCNKDKKSRATKLIRLRSIRHVDAQIHETRSKKYVDQCIGYGNITPQGTAFMALDLKASPNNNYQLQTTGLEVRFSVTPFPEILPSRSSKRFIAL